jgi:hypothetical protein
MSSFSVLGIPPTSTSQQVLHAWRRLARDHHPDKTGAGPDTFVALNEAKTQCLEAISKRNYPADEQEFVLFICRKLEKKILQECDLHIDLGEGRLIRPTLQKFMWFHAVDAMRWVLGVFLMDDMEFDQDIEDEIPVICKFYNDFIGSDQWTEDDYTFMMVLNKYDEIKARFAGESTAGALVRA